MDFLDDISKKAPTYLDKAFDAYLYKEKAKVDSRLSSSVSSQRSMYTPDGSAGAGAVSSDAGSSGFFSLPVVVGGGVAAVVLLLLLVRGR